MGVKLYVFSLSVAALCTSESVLAQSCDAILAQGLRNVTISKSAGASETTKYYNNCGIDASSMTDEQLAKAEVEVFGSGRGGGSFTRSQREEQLKQWCTGNAEAAKANQSLYLESQQIYSDSLRAWDSCNRLRSADVQIDPLITPDSHVTMSIRYTGAGRGPRLYGISATNFTCDMRVPTDVSQDKIASEGVDITNQAISVSCARVGDDPEKLVGGEKFHYLPSATMVPSLGW